MDRSTPLPQQRRRANDDVRGVIRFTLADSSLCAVVVFTDVLQHGSTAFHFITKKCIKQSLLFSEFSKLKREEKLERGEMNFYFGSLHSELPSAPFIALK